MNNSRKSDDACNSREPLLWIKFFTKIDGKPYEQSIAVPRDSLDSVVEQACRDCWYSIKTWETRAMIENQYGFQSHTNCVMHLNDIDIPLDGISYCVRSTTKPNYDEESTLLGLTKFPTIISGTLVALNIYSPQIVNGPLSLTFTNEEKKEATVSLGQVRFSKGLVSEHNGIMYVTNTFISDNIG